MAGERSAVLLDWGGVMTTNLFDSFAAFCSAEGLDAGALADLFRCDRDARTLLVDFECGRIDEAEFEPRLAVALGVAEHAGLIDGLFAGSKLNRLMVAGVRRLHDDGVRTGLVSNSWGTRRYPHELIAELNRIGGKHGVGQVTLVENRLVGMKSRGVYETPGGTILYEAHKALEQLCLERGLHRRLAEVLAILDVEALVAEGRGDRTCVVDRMAERQTFVRVSGVADHQRHRARRGRRRCRLGRGRRGRSRVPTQRLAFR